MCPSVEPCSCIISAGIGGHEAITSIQLTKIIGILPDRYHSTGLLYRVYMFLGGQHRGRIDQQRYVV